MKRLIQVILVMAIILLQSCAKPQKSEMPNESLTLEDQNVPNEQSITPIPSEDAEAIGITAENYPRIDGSTSTLPLVQSIYQKCFTI